MTPVDALAVRRYLEASFAADDETCDEIVRHDLRDHEAALDLLLDLAAALVHATAERVEREAHELLGTLFAQAARERASTRSIEEGVRRRVDGERSAGDSRSGRGPLRDMADVAALLAIVTQGLAVIRGDALAAVLDDVWATLDAAAVAASRDGVTTREDGRSPISPE